MTCDVLFVPLRCPHPHQAEEGITTRSSHLFSLRKSDDFATWLPRCHTTICRYFSGSDVCATFFSWKSKPHQGLSPRTAESWESRNENRGVFNEIFWYGFWVNFWWICDSLFKQIPAPVTPTKSLWKVSRRLWDQQRRNLIDASGIPVQLGHVSPWILFDDDSGHCHLAIQTVGFSLHHKQTQKTLGLSLPTLDRSDCAVWDLYSLSWVSWGREPSGLSLKLKFGSNDFFCGLDKQEVFQTSANWQTRRLVSRHSQTTLFHRLPPLKALLGQCSATSLKIWWRQWRYYIDSDRFRSIHKNNQIIISNMGIICPRERSTSAGLLPMKKSAARMLAKGSSSVLPIPLT